MNLSVSCIAEDQVNPFRDASMAPYPIAMIGFRSQRAQPSAKCPISWGRFLAGFVLLNTRCLGQAVYKPKHRTRKEDTDFFQQLLEANRRAEAAFGRRALGWQDSSKHCGPHVEAEFYEWRVILDSKGGCATVPKPERQRADRLPQLERAPLQPVASAVASRRRTRITIVESTKAVPIRAFRFPAPTVNS